MSDENDRTSTGITGFDAHLQGGYPKGKIVLEGPYSDERSSFTLSFAAQGLREGDFVIIVTSSISLAKVRKGLRKLGIDVKHFERSGQLIIVDWYSHSVSKVLELEEIGAVIKCPGDALHLNEAFGKAFSRFPKEGNYRAVVDGLSSLIGEYDVDSALLLASSATSTLGKDQSTALFVIDSEAHDSSIVSHLEKSFDGYIRLRRIEGEKPVVGKISVHSMKDTEIPADGLLLELADDETLRIGSGAHPEGGELDEEISTLMPSLKKDSQNPVTWFEMGTHYAADGENEKAHECYDMAIKLRPDYLAAWTSKANLFIEEGKNDEAVQCYKKALTLSADSPEVPEESEEEEELKGTGICSECGTEIDLGDPFCLGCGADMPTPPVKSKDRPVDEVLATCEARIRKNPEDVDAWFVKGLCLARLGRYQESINALNEATRLDVEYPGLWFVKGKVYAKLGDEKKATLSLKRGLDFVRRDTDRVGATFECSICGESVGLSASQCPNCGASFETKAEKVVLPDTEEELISFPDEVTLDDVLKRWETELSDLITPEEEPPETFPKPAKKVRRVKKAVTREEGELTGRPISELREAKVSRRKGLTNGIGRTNGLTNGLVNGIRRKREGRVNGLRGRTNGLTNGRRGRTNGLTNGLRGRTNGLTNGVRGRTNGLTNGVRGRTNGLTNGVRGRTNGLTNGLTNGVRGRTNGLTNGLVNGLGRATGVTNGLVNGLKSLKFSLADGLTNGNGLTNGLGVRRFGREMRLARWKVFFIPLIAFALLAVPLFVVTSPAPSERVAIDGQFSDWNRLMVTQMSPSGVEPNADIVEASVDMSSRTVFFYLEVLGYMLQGNPSLGIGDVVQIFIDSDKDYQTGYQLRGLGADRLVEIFGIDNQLRSSVFKEYLPTGQGNDWNRWTTVGKVNAAIGPSEMEISVSRMRLGQDVSSVLVMFHTLSCTGDEDFSDYVLSESGGVLDVLQRSAITLDVIAGVDQDLLNIELYAYNKDVTLSSLQVEILGSVQSSEVNSLELYTEQSQLLDQVIFLGNPVTFEFDPVTIEKDGSTSLDVRADLAGSAGNTIGAVVPSSSSIGVDEDAATITYISSIRDLGYVGQVPSGTIIDGGFLDWANCSNFDDTGELSLQGDTNIDMSCYDDAVSGSTLFVYYDVLGRMMAGTNVPSRSPTLRQQVSPGIIDSDKDTVPDEHDIHRLDFNNDGISDGQTPLDLDDDGVNDHPYGLDYWLNTTIPASYPPPYAGRNVTRYIGPVEKPVVVGEDVARIYIDTDNSTLTGYSGFDIGSEYMVEIRGMNGKATYSNLFEFDGGFPGEWKWNLLGSAVDVALDSRQLEMSVDSSSMSLQPDFAVAFETTDWWGGSDASILPATRAFPEPRTRHFADANGGYGLVVPDGGTIDITIDGTIDEGTETDWTTTAKTDTYGSNIKTYVVYNASDIFIAVEVLAQTTGNGDVEDFAEITFDTNHTGGTVPQTDDFKFQATDSTAGSPTLEEYAGTGSLWDSEWNAVEWTASADDSDTYVTFEFRINNSYAFGEYFPSDGDIAGFCVHVYSKTGDTYYYWPDATGSGSLSNGREDTPDDWGDLFYTKPRLVINEVSPLSATEWVELYNGGESIDINGIVLSDQDGFTWTRSSSLDVPNDVYLVLMGGSGTDDTDFSDGNGTLYIGTTEFTDAGDDVLLKYGGNDMGFDYVQYGTGGDIQSCPSDPASENSWTGSITAPTGTNTVGRDKDSSDTNNGNDWDNTGGPDVSAPTRGHINYGCTLTVTGSDQAPTVAFRSETEIVMLSLTFSADYGWIGVTNIEIDRTGTSTTESDISAATLWEDINGDGDYDSGTDTFIASASYSSGVYTFSGLSIGVHAGTDKDLLVMYNVSTSSTLEVTAGAELDGASSITVHMSDSIGAFSTISSTNMLIRYSDILVLEVTGEVHESLDGGKSFTYKGDASDDSVAVCANRTNTDIYSFVTNGSVYLSTDLGQTWSHRGDAFGGGSSGIDMTIDSNDDIYLIRTSGEVYSSTDGGATYTTRGDSGKNIIGIEANYSNTDLYVVETDGDVAISTDGGDTWTARGDANSQNDNKDIAIDSNGYIYVLQSSGEVNRSTDYGNTFSGLSDIGTATYVGMTIDTFYDYIYVVDSVGGVYLSTDGGSNWVLRSDIGSETDYEDITCIIIPEFPQFIFVVLSCLALFAVSRPNRLKRWFSQNGTRKGSRA